MAGAKDTTNTADKGDSSSTSSSETPEAKAIREAEEKRVADAKAEEAKAKEDAETEAKRVEAEEAEKQKQRDIADQTKPKADPQPVETFAALRNEPGKDSKGRNADLTVSTDRDREMQADRDARFQEATGGVTPQGKDFVELQHELVEQTKQERDELNAEGMAAIEEAQEREAELAHNNPTHVPTGREVDVNTPRLDKAGNKIW